MIEPTFKALKLPATILTALTELGYETPTPIQMQSIPVLLKGGDLVAQAQTGTGKTAAFALPILAHLEPEIKKPQALVIVPTRELAIQVAEAFQSYAKHIKNFHVLPIYGGQDYQVQLRALKRGAHVVVGTPGRVMDHLRRGVLAMDEVKTVVLDEADEMLKMGFLEDIEWILEKITHAHQTALFSATMPTSIQKTAKRYLNDASEIQIKPTKKTVDSIAQVYMCVANHQKLDVLTRVLEIEEHEAILIFARTKNASAELAEKLQARGYAAAALNGDMSQSLREKVINKIKNGSIDIVAATDVAARGIDVERVTHVINFDMPYDTESYIHRIGRTGRAGRKGKAILFVTPRERRLLNDIERAIHKPIEEKQPPSLQEMKEKRHKQFEQKVVEALGKTKKLKPYLSVVENIAAKNECTPIELAAALAYLIQKSNPMPTQEIGSATLESDSRRRAPSNSRRKSSDSRSKKRSNRPLNFKKASPKKKKFGGKKSNATR